MSSFHVSGYGLSGFWFLAACAVGFCVFLAKGSEAASSYAAGYLLEMSLSVDNFCAFLLLFRVFNVRTIVNNVLSTFLCKPTGRVVPGT